MNRQENNKIIRILILGILAAGAAHMLDHFFRDSSFSALFFLGNLLIYLGMILYWIRSVRDRLLPTPARLCILVSGWMMILYLLLRSVKFRLVHSPLQGRYCWYGYYLPTILMTALFFILCLWIGSERKMRNRLAPLSLAFALCLVSLVMTNDLHGWVFRSLVGEALQGETGTYTRGPVFYLIYGFIGLMVMGGVALLTRSLQKRGSSRKALIPLGLLLTWTVILELEAAVSGWSPGLFPYKMPETCVFCMLFIMETCIQSRLIPYNDHYGAFFRQIRIPLLITDRNFRRMDESGAGLPYEREVLEESLQGSLYPREGLRLSGRELRGGYAFWVTDEREVLTLNRRLEEANEVLAGENELIRAERELEERKARTEARSRIYEELAREMMPAYRQVGALLDRAKPGTPGFSKTVARVALWNAYIKRRSNLLLLRSEGEAADPRELVLALQESARYLAYCGVDVFVDEESGEKTPIQVLLALYDAFHDIALQLTGRATQLMVSLGQKELRLTTDCRELPEPDPKDVRVKMQREEGLLFIRIFPKEVDRHDLS